MLSDARGIVSRLGETRALRCKSRPLSGIHGRGVWPLKGLRAPARRGNGLHRGSSAIHDRDRGCRPSSQPYGRLTLPLIREIYWTEKRKWEEIHDRLSGIGGEAFPHAGLDRLPVYRGPDVRWLRPRGLWHGRLDLPARSDPDWPGRSCACWRPRQLRIARRSRRRTPCWQHRRHSRPAEDDPRCLCLVLARHGGDRPNAYFDHVQGGFRCNSI
jgi:hypothetical protein